MHDKEYNDLLKAMQDQLKKINQPGAAGKKASREFLISAGIITKKGNFTKPYWSGVNPGEKCKHRKNAKDRKNRK